MVLKKYRLPLLFVLTLSYFLTGIGGQLFALGRLVNVGTSHHHIARERSSRPIDSRPYWTSYKHIPIAEKSFSPVVLHTVHDLRIALDREGQLLSISSDAAPESAFRTTQSARAPPFAPSLS